MKFRKLFALAAVLLVGALLATTPAQAQTTTLTTDFNLRIKGNLQAVGDLGTAKVEPELSKVIQLASGVGANQANKIFADTRTLALSTTEDLDVSGGALVDQLGVAFTIAKLKVVAVCARSTNTNTVVLLGDANSVPILNTAATTLALNPGACAVLFDPSLAGVAVTNATGDIIQIANGGAGTSVIYDIVIIGTSS